MTKDQKINNALITQVKVELVERNMYQKDLAAAMGIDPAVLNRYLTGKSGISMSVFYKIADALKLEGWELLRRIAERATQIP